MKTVDDPIVEAKESSARVLWMIYVVLMILLIATVVVAYLPFGRMNLVLASLIAVTKAGLVIWFFMHLRETQRLVGILFGASLFMILVAAILSFADYLTRG